VYTYIESGVFKEFGVDNFSLKEQLNRKLPKKYKKRKEPANFNGRKYGDFMRFREENPETPVTEMDAVYNLMFSHINSVPRLSLCDKTPYEMFCFLHSAKAAHLLNIASVPRDEVVLKPCLIFRKNKQVQRVMKMQD
jgi:hypothetical protein